MEGNRSDETHQQVAVNEALPEEGIWQVTDDIKLDVDIQLKEEAMQDVEVIAVDSQQEIDVQDANKTPIKTVKTANTTRMAEIKAKESLVADDKKLGDAIDVKEEAIQDVENIADLDEQKIDAMAVKTVKAPITTKNTQVKPKNTRAKAKRSLELLDQQMDDDIKVKEEARQAIEIHDVNNTQHDTDEQGTEIITPRKTGKTPIATKMTGAKAKNTRAKAKKSAAKEELKLDDDVEFKEETIQVIADDSQQEDKKELDKTAVKTIKAPRTMNKTQAKARVTRSKAKKNLEGEEKPNKEQEKANNTRGKLIQKKTNEKMNEEEEITNDEASKSNDEEEKTNEEESKTDVEDEEPDITQKKAEQTRVEKLLAKPNQKKENIMDLPNRTKIKRGLRCHENLINAEEADEVQEIKSEVQATPKDSRVKADKWQKEAIEVQWKTEGLIFDRNVIDAENVMSLPKRTKIKRGLRCQENLINAEEADKVPEITSEEQAIPKDSRVKADKWQEEAISVLVKTTRITRARARQPPVKTVTPKGKTIKLQEDKESQETIEMMPEKIKKPQEKIEKTPEKTRAKLKKSQEKATTEMQVEANEKQEKLIKVQEKQQKTQEILAKARKLTDKTKQKEQKEDEDEIQVVEQVTTRASEEKKKEASKETKKSAVEYTPGPEWTEIGRIQ